MRGILRMLNGNRSLSNFRTKFVSAVNEQRATDLSKADPV